MMRFALRRRIALMPARRHLYWLAAVMLVLAFLAGAELQPAHADNHAQIDDPGWTSPRYTLNAEVQNRPEQICPGDQLVILTYLYVWDIPPSQRAQHAGPTVAGYNRAGVEIMGRGESYGTVSPRTAITRLIETPQVSTNMAPFLYTAKNPGVETLTFDAGPPAPAGTEAVLQFEVEKCEQLLVMIYRGVLEFPPGRATFSGVIDPITLDAGAEGQYSAATTMQLAEAFSVPGTGCTVVGSVAGSQANITATTNDQMLDLSFTFQRTTHTVTANCPGGSASAAGQWGADLPGPVSVSIPTKGGTGRYVETAMAYRGEYTFIVERVPDNSVAAIPGTVRLAARP